MSEDSLEAKGEKNYEVERFQDSNGKWFERYIKIKEIEVNPFEETEEDIDYEALAEKRKQEISDMIEKYLDSRHNYRIVESGSEWMLIAKITKLRINRVYNPESFQEMDKTEEECKCLLTVVVFGEDPKYGESAYMLMEIGCPVIRLHTKYDISKLDTI